MWNWLIYFLNVPSWPCDMVSTLPGQIGRDWWGSAVNASQPLDLDIHNLWFVHIQVSHFHNIYSSDILQKIIPGERLPGGNKPFVVHWGPRMGHEKDKCNQVTEAVLALKEWKVVSNQHNEMTWLLWLHSIIWLAWEWCQVPSVVNVPIYKRGKTKGCSNCCGTLFSDSYKKKKSKVPFQVYTSILCKKTWRLVSQLSAEQCGFRVPKDARTCSSCISFIRKKFYEVN